MEYSRRQTNNAPQVRSLVVNTKKYLNFTMHASGRRTKYSYHYNKTYLKRFKFNSPGFVLQDDKYSDGHDVI